jgi:hypothetical protein
MLVTMLLGWEAYLIPPQNVRKRPRVCTPPRKYNSIPWPTSPVTFYTNKARGQAICSVNSESDFSVSENFSVSNIKE